MPTARRSGVPAGPAGSNRSRDLVSGRADLGRSVARLPRAMAAAKLKANPVVGLLGPRRAGKTTLAGQIAAARAGPRHHFDFADELVEAVPLRTLTAAAG